MTRSYEIPVRIGSDIYIETKDGVRHKIDALLAAQMAAMWLDVVKGAFVYQKTREG